MSRFPTGGEQVLPTISVVIPWYDMPNAQYFLSRAIDSVLQQSYKDWELIVTKSGKMAENTNDAIKRARGLYIKILYMDDYLAHADSLFEIVKAFDENPNKEWLVSGCNHDPGTHTHLPTWNDKIADGVNTIGSPSVVTLRNTDPLLFNEDMTWLLDCDLYLRYKEFYGEPIYLNDINVTIGVGEHQSTHLMGDEVKIKEHQMMKEKYA